MTATVLTRSAPLDLVIPDRLDLVIKWRYFLNLRDRSDPDANRLYLQHITARTGGYEPDGTKPNLAHYVTAARKLHASMSEFGFDLDYPVRFGNNGRLMDGAHRIACALALRIRYVPIERSDKPGRARAWGADFLIAGGMDAADVERVEADYRALKGIE